MGVMEPEEQRAVLREGWERSAPGWGERAAAVRDWGMPVSTRMIDRLNLQPGQRVLELAAGPGDTGFLAAEIVAPGGGVVISSDGAEAMVEVERRIDRPEVFLEETLTLSESFRRAWDGLDDPARERVGRRLRELSEPMRGPDGDLRIGGRSLVAAASA